MTHRPQVPVDKLERLAKLICDGEDDPELREQAQVIAENEFRLQSISAQQIAAIERVRDVTAIAFAKGENSLRAAKARSRKSRKAYAILKQQVPVMIEKYKDRLPATLHPLCWGEFVPLNLQVLLKEDEEQPTVEEAGWPFSDETKERDEGEAIEEAVRDLIRLDRYHRRVWSQQKRAIYRFMNIKLMRDMDRDALSLDTMCAVSG